MGLLGSIPQSCGLYNRPSKAGDVIIAFYEHFSVRKEWQATRAGAPLWSPLVL